MTTPVSTTTSTSFSGIIDSDSEEKGEEDKHRIYQGISPNIYFTNCMILTNVLHFMRGSNSSLFFGLVPLLTAEEYLQSGIELYESFSE